MRESLYNPNLSLVLSSLYSPNLASDFSTVGIEQHEYQGINQNHNKLLALALFQCGNLYTVLI